MMFVAAASDELSKKTDNLYEKCNYREYGRTTYYFQTISVFNKAIIYYNVNDPWLSMLNIFLTLS